MPHDVIHSKGRFPWLLETRLLSGRVVRTHVLWIDSHRQYDFRLLSREEDDLLDGKSDI